MPKFHSWMIHAPTEWTGEQLADYLRGTIDNLIIGMTPVVAIGSPLAAVNCLLTVIFKIGVDNPDWREQIVDAMDEAAETLDKMRSVQ